MFIKINSKKQVIMKIVDKEKITNNKCFIFKLIVNLFLCDSQKLF